MRNRKLYSVQVLKVLGSTVGYSGYVLMFQHASSHTKTKIHNEAQIRKLGPFYSFIC